VTSVLRSQRLASQDGYTLVELRVVIVVLAVLGLLAVPLLLGQRGKGQDGTAKFDARSVASVVEACNTSTEDPGGCNFPTALRAAHVTFGRGPGKIEVEVPSTRSYTVTAHSGSGTDFVLARVASGEERRTCSRPGRGGCGKAGTW
jgi:prepilin-type N-terminal cleavage/methylation domain-containing protein